MSWHFLQAGEVASWEGVSLDGAPSALLSLLPTPEAFCSRGRQTEALNPSPFGTMCEPSTDTLGADVSISSLEDSPAKTSAQQEAAPGLAAAGRDFGARWLGLLARYDPATSLWKTPQCSLVEGLDEFSETWPRWGTMLDGVCWEQSMPALPISEIESGSWPTPVKNDARGWLTDGCPSQFQMLRRSRANVLSRPLRGVPTPTKHDHKSEWSTRSETLAQFVGSSRQASGLKLNPTWVEWLMGWPLGWTELQPLETAKFQQWFRLHGTCLQEHRA